MTLRPMDVTPEIIEALRTLRAFAAGPTLPNSVRAAVNTLDNAEVFAVIDEQTGYDVDPEPAPAVDTTPTGYELDPEPDPMLHGGYGDDETPTDPEPAPGKCRSCGLRVADGSEYHKGCRPLAYTPYPTDPDASTH